MIEKREQRRYLTKKIAAKRANNTLTRMSDDDPEGMYKKETGFHKYMPPLFF